MFVIDEVDYEVSYFKDTLSDKARGILSRIRKVLLEVEDEERLEKLESIAKKCLTVAAQYNTVPYAEAGNILLLATASTILNNLNEED